MGSLSDIGMVNSLMVAKNILLAKIKTQNLLILLDGLLKCCLHSEVIVVDKTTH